MGGGFFGGQRNDIYPTFEEYSSIICSEIKKISNSISLIIEPGASILATAVEYIAKVIDLKFIRNVGVVTTDGSILHVNPFMVFGKQRLVAGNYQRRIPEVLRKNV